MKKKILTAILAALAAGTMVFAMAGCNGSSQPQLNNLDTGAVMEIKDVKAKGIEGLCDYIFGNGCLAYYSGSENGRYFDMLADVIGAKDGRKYYFNVGDKPTIVEIYEYDTNNLSDTAKSVIDSVNSTGEFQVSAVNESVKNVKMSPSGKYLYINSGAGETDDQHASFNEKLNKLIAEYDEKENNTK